MQEGDHAQQRLAATLRRLIGREYGRSFLLVLDLDWPDPTRKNVYWVCRDGVAFNVEGDLLRWEFLGAGILEEWIRRVQERELPRLHALAMNRRN